VKSVNMMVVEHALSAACLAKNVTSQSFSQSVGSCLWSRLKRQMDNYRGRPSRCVIYVLIASSLTPGVPFFVTLLCVCDCNRTITGCTYCGEHELRSYQEIRASNS
jgi:hypothetical protein